MGRTYRRDDYHSWGKISKDKRYRGNSERYRADDDNQQNRKLKGNKKFNVNYNEYNEEEWY